MKKIALAALMAILSPVIFAQYEENWSSSKILLKLKKLNVLGNALYVAAHPDDENTRLITYLSNETLVNTAYLSMSRGDGGQNLIGPEIRELLGIIRTQELLAARRRDGGYQFFTRANDFGYSKSADETLKLWDKDKVLYDAVWTIRKFRPDVIITRFPADSRAGHGQHTTSAIVANEAFNLAGDPEQYTSQLDFVKTWQPIRLLLNTGRWWRDSISADDPGVITVDIGTYNPLLGASYSEIASVSSSQHKSQGFGRASFRGSAMEFLEHTLGNQADLDLFEGIDITWNRVKGGKPIQQEVEQLIKSFDPVNPSQIIPGLFKVRKMVSKLNDDFWREIKLKEIDDLIKHSAGLYLEVRTNSYSFTYSDSIKASVEILNRSYYPFRISKVSFPELNKEVSLNYELEANQRYIEEFGHIIPNNISFSQPYWLRQKGSIGMYEVENHLDIGKPQNDPPLTALFELRAEGTTIHYSMPLIYRWSDPVKGELYRPLEISPPVFVNVERKVYLFSDDSPREVRVMVKSGKSNLTSNVTLDVPENWSFKPEFHQVTLKEKDQEEWVVFAVTPPLHQETGEIKVVANVDGTPYTHSLVRIEYDHIPIQTLFPESSAEVVKLDIKTNGNTIGYIMGAGDEVPETLEQIGYTVWEMSDEEVIPANLKGLDAVILGVRALNTNERIKFQMPLLLDYVEQGGTLIIQYNTSRRLKTNDFAPYPIKLSRFRVSEEDAPVRILKPQHKLMTTPNKITSSDFEGWVQERGLYFPGEWSEEYEEILSSNDTGEEARDGGLLVAQYGKGYYIYTGYSWFRELPAGVPGAIRIFANMISIGNDNKNLKLGRKEE